MRDINLSRHVPSAVAEQLIAGSASVGLVPVASISKISNAQIITDYCIGSDGEVGSVCIYSQVPIEEVTSIYMDYQSRTSTELARFLLSNYWNIQPETKTAFEGYEQLIEGDAAGLIIGDRCLLHKNQFKYCYDLGKFWKIHTGMPFVFACWVSNIDLPGNFIASFNKALGSGIENIPMVVKQYEGDFKGIDIADYLHNKIRFNLDNGMRRGMNSFLQYLTQQPELNTTNRHGVK